MPVPFPVSLKLIYHFFLRQKAVNGIHHLFALHQYLCFKSFFFNINRGIYAVGIDNAGLFF